MIMFLIKTVFWLGLVILLIPVETNEVEHTTSTSISAQSTLDAAVRTWHDITGFCERNEEICEQGSDAVLAFAHKAKQTTKLLHDSLEAYLADNSTDSQTIESDQNR